MSWEQVKLGDIFEIARGGSPRPIDQYITDDPNGLNWISIKDASNSSKYIYKTEKKIKPEGLHKTRLVHPNDFLLTNSMSFGRPYIMKTTGCIHDGWLVLSADKTKVDTDYFYHLLGSDFMYRKFAGLAAGAVVKNLNTELVKSVSVPLPPLAEQRRIASILDQADELRQKRQQAIEKLDQLLQATFIDMFGDPVSNPKGWKKVPVGDVTTCIVPGRDKPKKFSGNIPWITTDDLIPLGYTSVSKKHTGLTEYEIEEVRAKIIPSNSVVMSCVGNLGLTSIAINPFVMNQQLHGFQCTENLTPEFLMFYLPFEKNYMLSRATSTTLPYMNKSVCNSIPIILPDINLQEKWTNLFIKVEDQKQKLYKQLEIQDNLFKSLQNQAFSGNL